MTIDFEFFKKKMDYFLWIEKQQKGLESLFDCDIYGGPMKVWDHELEFWRAVLKSNEAYHLLVGFAPFYSSPHCEYETSFEYDWNGNDDMFSYHSESIELEGAVSRENWVKAIWFQICKLEEKENERN